TLVYVEKRVDVVDATATFTGTVNDAGTNSPLNPWSEDGDNASDAVPVTIPTGVTVEVKETTTPGDYLLYGYQLVASSTDACSANRDDYTPASQLPDGIQASALQKVC